MGDAGRGLRAADNLGMVIKRKSSAVFAAERSKISDCIAWCGSFSRSRSADRQDQGK